ncbi:MAG: phosphoadenylyl-sulfate reductase [cyanobacterium endosymbiont of Rhopalodia gibba]
MPHIDLLNSQMQVNGTQAISVHGSQPHHTPKILKPSLDLQATNQLLSNRSAQNVVEWSANTFGDGLVMSTSFGIQAAVMLHLVTQVVSHIPVIWVDTGYLPAETYCFAEKLSRQLNLNLRIYQSPLTPGRMEALYGKLWDKKDLESLNLYDNIRKVEPMQRALLELNATAWLAGLRRTQTSHRKSLERVEQQGNYYKVHPILHWDSRDIYQYLTVHNLPYHPYFEKGYVSVGDWHSSRPMIAGDESERDSRFHGLKQECGLHLPLTPEAAQSLDSSTL